MFFLVSSFHAKGLRVPSPLPSESLIHGNIVVGVWKRDSSDPQSFGDGIGISAGETKP